MSIVLSYKVAFSSINVLNPSPLRQTDTNEPGSLNLWQTLLMFFFSSLQRFEPTVKIHRLDYSPADRLFSGKGLKYQE